MKNKFLDLENKNPHHAYLVIAGKIEQKESVSYFIEKLKIKLPDIFMLASSDSIKIQDIRILQHFIGLKPHSSSFKLAVIDNSELLTQDAANALLKTLEEPPENSIIILLAETHDEMLKTIVSRCRIVKIPRKISFSLEAEKERLYGSILEMNIKERFELAGNIIKKDETEEFLDDWLKYLRTILQKDPKWLYLVKYIYQMKKNLKYNINHKLLLENIFLEVR